jgi:hypothetical protein
MIKRIVAALLCALLMIGCAGALAEETQVNTQVRHYLLLGQDGYADDIVKDARTDTIVLVTLVGVLLFREKLSKRKIAALGVILVSLSLLNL